MPGFKEVLGAGESIFRNEEALDAEWVPKVLPFREAQQRHIISCIKPLLEARNGMNLFVYGLPGIGKTAATRWVLRDLEDTTDEVIPLYVNCWQKNTTHKILLEICRQIGYVFTQNKNTEELFEEVAKIVNKKQAVFVFDEVDKVEELNFLYSILTDIYKKTVVLITNYKEWLVDVEERIRSRLMAETLEFKNYNEQEIAEILKQRVEFAFVPGCWEREALEAVARKAAAAGDVRAGLHLLREAGLAAEESASKKITFEHAEKAIAKLSDFTIKNSAELEDDTRNVLKIANEHSGKRIGELWEIYKSSGGKGTYKTFQRRVEKLEKAKFITTEKTAGGKEGNTTIIYSKNKSLAEFQD